MLTSRARFGLRSALTRCDERAGWGSPHLVPDPPASAPARRLDVVDLASVLACATSVVALVATLARR